MRRFYMNVAKSYVGRNVNLHLKDRSVVINVLLTGVKGNRRSPKLHYQTPYGSAEVSMKHIDWIQSLNSLFNF